MFSAQRYVAYTSDVGEAFRPVVSPRIVSGAYAISWAYLGYDVFSAGRKAFQEHHRPLYPDCSLFVAKQATFQSLASMALPAFTIHSTVSLASKVCKKLKIFQKWGPTAAGMAVLPILPYLFDEPVEKVVDAAFDYAFPSVNLHLKHE